MNQQLLPIKVFFRVIGTVVVVAALIFLVLAFFFKLDAGAALVAGMIGGLVVLKLQGCTTYSCGCFVLQPKSHLTVHPVISLLTRSGNDAATVGQLGNRFYDTNCLITPNLVHGLFITLLVCILGA